MSKRSVTIPDEAVMRRIHVIRGQKVMLDRDLAELYGVETRVLKQAVRRNMERFPEDFMFELNKEEQEALTSQTVILKRGEHSKYQPFVFTEHERKFQVIFRYLKQMEKRETERVLLAEVAKTKPRNPVGFKTAKRKK